VRVRVRVCVCVCVRVYNCTYLSIYSDICISKQIIIFTHGSYINTHKEIYARQGLEISFNDCVHFSLYSDICISTQIFNFTHRSFISTHRDIHARQWAEIWFYDYAHLCVYSDICISSQSIAGHHTLTFAKHTHTQTYTQACQATLLSSTHMCKTHTHIQTYTQAYGIKRLYFRRGKWTKWSKCQRHNTLWQCAGVSGWQSCEHAPRSPYYCAMDRRGCVCGVESKAWAAHCSGIWLISLSAWFLEGHIQSRAACGSSI